MKKLFVLTILSCLCLFVSTISAEEGTPQEILQRAASGGYNNDGTLTRSVDALLLLRRSSDRIRRSLNRKPLNRSIKEKYKYDELNQLVEWENAYSKTTYTYDEIGNRTVVEVIKK